MGVDVHEPGLNVGNASRIVRGLGFMQQRVALQIGLQHDIDKAFGTVGRPRGGPAGSPPRIAWNSVDLPTPLRPTKPTRAPGTICAELLSIRSRPAIRTEMSVIESMPAFHRSRPKTQPVY